MNKSLLTFLSLVLALGFAAEARAGIITPVGLSPGAQFRIVFVTSTVHTAFSSSIADYDAIVTARAIAGGLDTYNGSSVIWQIIGSTSTVSAISRLPISSPALYLSHGALVATGGADLWDGSLSQRIDRTELGSNVFGFIFSGTLSSGESAGTFSLGSSPVMIGQNGSDTSHWIQSFSAGSGNNLRFYGFSSVLTVGPATSVPEPASLTLALAGLGAYVGTRCLARRRRATASRPTEYTRAHS